MSEGHTLFPLVSFPVDANPLSDRDLFLSRKYRKIVYNCQTSQTTIPVQNENNAHIQKYSDKYNPELQRQYTPFLDFVRSNSMDSYFPTDLLTMKTMRIGRKVPIARIQLKRKLSISKEEGKNEEKANEKGEKSEGAQDDLEVEAESEEDDYTQSYFVDDDDFDDFNDDLDGEDEPVF